MEKSKSKKNMIIGGIIIAVVAVIAVVAMFIVKDGLPKKIEGDINPLTGLEVEKDSLPSRPIVFSTDNDNSDARPQAGLGSADIVYEVPIEGGGSRYEQIFYSEMPEKVGPARSARPYIVDIAREYKAVFVHNGWSPQAKAYLQQNVVPYYAAAFNGSLFYRTTDRYIPHNMYTNLKDVWERIKSDGYDEKQEIRTFQWLGEKDEVKGKKANTVHVNYADHTNNTYKYNEEEKLYYRFVNDNKCVDQNTDQQVTCANILIQRVPYRLYDGESERLQIDMTCGGEAYLITQGKAIKGTWSRESLDSATIFKDADGNEVKMTPGKTWIQLIDSTVGFSYEK